MPSLLPSLTGPQWLHTIAGMMCFTFSYGFLRSWPNLFQPIRDALNENVTQFLPSDTNSSELVPNPDFVMTQTLTTTSACMLNGLQLCAAFCGLILPKLGNRNATMMAGTLAIFGYMVMPYLVMSRNWIGLYALCVLSVGIPMGIVNSSAQNNIKNNVPGSGRGFATTFAVAGNTVGHFGLPIIFDFYANTFPIETTLRMSGALFVFLIVAGFLMKPTEDPKSSNPSEKKSSPDGSSVGSEAVVDDKCEKDQKAKQLIEATKENPQIASKKLWVSNRAYQWYAIHFVFALGAYFASLSFLPVWIEKQTVEGHDINSVRLKCQQILAIAEAVGRFIGLCIIEKTDKSKILGPTYLTLAVGWTIFTYGLKIGGMVGINGIWIFYISMAIVGVATGTFGGTFFAQAMDLIPRQKHAVGMSMLNLLSGLFNFTAIYVFGILFDNVNADLPLLASAVLYVISTVLCVFIYKNREAGKEQEALITEQRLQRQRDAAKSAIINIDVRTSSDERMSMS